MSSPYQVLIRTSQNLGRVRGDLEQALRASGARLDVGMVDAEDAQDAQRFFQLSPNLSADVTPTRPGQEGALFVAVLSWARSAWADVAILLDWELVAALRGGSLQAVSSERPFFEREVLPSLGASVSWVPRS